MAKSKKTVEIADEATIDFLSEVAEKENAGAGFGDMDSTTMAIPFLKLLQDLSPEVKKNKTEYVEGAEPGMFINSVTKEIFTEVPCIVLAFEHIFNEWTANRGPLVARHAKSEFSRICINPQDFGRYKTADGNDLVETYMYYLLIVGHEEEGPVCFSATKTQITPSQAWNRMIASLTFPNNTKAPGEYGKYTLVPVAKASDKGDYWSFKAVRHEQDKFITRDQLEFVKREKAALPEPEKVSASLQIAEGNSAGKGVSTKY